MPVSSFDRIQHANELDQGAIPSEYDEFVKFVPPTHPTFATAICRDTDSGLPDFEFCERVRDGLQAASGLSRDEFDLYLLIKTGVLSLRIICGFYSVEEGRVLIDPSTLARRIQVVDARIRKNFDWDLYWHA